MKGNGSWQEQSGTERLLVESPSKGQKRFFIWLNSGKSFKLDHSNSMQQSDTRTYAPCWKNTKETRHDASSLSVWLNSSKKWCRRRRVMMIDNLSDSDNKNKSPWLNFSKKWWRTRWLMMIDNHSTSDNQNKKGRKNSYRKYREEVQNGTPKSVSILRSSASVNKVDHSTRESSLLSSKLWWYFKTTLFVVVIANPTTPCRMIRRKNVLF